MTTAATTHDVTIAATGDRYRVACSSCGELDDFGDYGAATNVARWHRRQNSPQPAGDPFAGIPGSGAPSGATGHTKQGAPMDTLTTDTKPDVADVAEAAPAEPAKPKRQRPSRSKAAKAERAAAAGNGTVSDIKAQRAKKETAKAPAAATPRPSNPVVAKAPPAPKATGPKFRLYHDGKPQTDVQNKLSSIAYDFTKDLAGDGSPRVGVKTFRAILADAGVSDPDGSAWKVTLDNGHVIESKAI